MSPMAVNAPETESATSWSAPWTGRSANAIAFWNSVMIGLDETAMRIRLVETRAVKATARRRAARVANIVLIRIPA